MSFQVANDLKLENAEALIETADNSVKHPLVQAQRRLADTVLIKAIWGTPEVPQSRRLIKTIHERR